MTLAMAAKPLKKLKTAMGGYWKKLAWIWVWRHSRLGLAPRPLGARAAPTWIDGTMPTVNAIRAIEDVRIFSIIQQGEDAQCGKRPCQ
jgi:hypothetical protein